MPIDRVPDPEGNVVPAEDGRWRVLTGAELPAQLDAWLPHFSTCTHADEHRGKPRCRRCQGPLDPELAETEPWNVTHPACTTT